MPYEARIWDIDRSNKSAQRFSESQKVSRANLKLPRSQKEHWAKLAAGVKESSQTDKRRQQSKTS